MFLEAYPKIICLYLWPDLVATSGDIVILCRCFVYSDSIKGEAKGKAIPGIFMKDLTKSTKVVSRIFDHEL
jgi:hypothetical protein